MRGPRSSGIGRGGGQRGSNWWGKVITAALTIPAGIGFVIYGVYEYLDGLGDSPSSSGQAVGNGFGISFGLLMLAIGFWAFLKVAPLKARGFTIEVQPADLRRGAAVDVRVAVSSPDRLGDGTEVGLVCVEHYSMTAQTSDSSYRDDVEDTAYEEWRPLRPGDARPYERFEVPADGPYSHEGEVLSYDWRVRVRRRRRLLPDPRLDERIWVSP